MNPAADPEALNERSDGPGRAVPDHSSRSIPSSSPLRIGVDVGGTFTDLVCWDGNALHAVKLPSSPPHFERAVVEAVRQARAARSPDRPCSIVHGSTVATNALLQRRGEPIAFVTTEGFRDVLLIGRQDRPVLYALYVRRPAAIVAPEHCFTVRERIGARGEVVEPLDPDDVDQLARRILAQGMRNVAVCLLFSFINPAHERLVADKLRDAGLTVSLSSELLPEFREYERASTTAVNAALRPTVETYLTSLTDSLGASKGSGTTALRIMHSGGGTLDARSACEGAVRLVLSGPAGGVIGAAHVASLAGCDRVITYDMGGTSTDVATVIDGAPARTTATRIDGLPIGVRMFDIVTIGAGGGSIARLDDGGALRVGPESAGALPGPACYGRGGTLPTVTDANVLLGRIPSEALLAGQLALDRAAAERALAALATRMRTSIVDVALGICRVAESNMARAMSAVTSRRGHDPREFTLVSFGGAGGLHAAALADELGIKRVLVPPLCGVLSALGMVVAPPVVEVSKTVLHLGAQLDDDRLAAEYGFLSARSIEQVSYDDTAAVEAFADARFCGQSHELTVPTSSPTRTSIEAAFKHAYVRAYGAANTPDTTIEIVTLRLQRRGHAAQVALSDLSNEPPVTAQSTLLDGAGRSVIARALNRRALLTLQQPDGPLLLLDTHSTTFVPAGWRASVDQSGSVFLLKVSE